ncbi:MAG: hypothetical protein DRQ55_16130 [Planctomycetota bacterium]|nr:MAG: hypothetical protein DRQ55_16130 [Planctomycetota bacterium]
MHPSELELAWETDPEGNYYTWTQAPPVSWNADATEITGEIDGYIPALVRTFNELKGISPATSEGITMVQINVTDDGGSFLATAATPVSDAIHTIEQSLRFAVQAEEERTALRTAERSS